MGNIPYHSYLFYFVANGFFQQSATLQRKQKTELAETLTACTVSAIDSYLTSGFKANSTFMLWVRDQSPHGVQSVTRAIRNSGMGQWMHETLTYYGLSRASTYSGRTGKPDQDSQQFTDRLPYLIVYPFTKTTAWYQLSLENRASIMGQHIKTGVSHPNIRQCLLYAFGVDDPEFIVSYETASLEEFQDLVMQMRSTIGRVYTQSDTPIHTGRYQPLATLLEEL